MSDSELRGWIDELQFSMAVQNTRSAYLRICTFFTEGEIHAPELHAEYGRRSMAQADEDVLEARLLGEYKKTTGESYRSTPEIALRNAAIGYFSGFEGMTPNFVRDGVFVDTDHMDELEILELGKKALEYAEHFPEDGVYFGKSRYMKVHETKQALATIVEGLMGQFETAGNGFAAQLLKQYATDIDLRRG